MRRRPRPAAGRAWRTHLPGRCIPAALGAAAISLLAAGCGSTARPHAPSQTPGGPVGVSAIAPAPPQATCGTTRTAVNVPVTIEVEKGSVRCATAMRIQADYTALVREGRVPGNGGGAPVEVHGWTCQGETTPTTVQTGETSACHNGGTEIIAVLKLPSSPGTP